MDYRRRATLEAVAAPDASPTFWGGAPEPTTNPQTKETTMNGISGKTTNAQTEERTMAESDTQCQKPTKKRNVMKDRAQKINQLRELVNARRTQEEICKEMEITPKGFERLRVRLMDIDGRYYDIPHETATRSGRVGKTGILISADRLVAMGIRSIFSEKTPISIRYVDGEIRIQRADRKNPHSSSQEGDFSTEYEEDFGRMFETDAGLECEEA